MYRYLAFGLHIASDIQIEELEIDDNNCSSVDVNIQLGCVPSHLEQPLEVNARFETSATEFLLNVDHVSKYYVKAGKVIIVEPYPNVELSIVNLFILGACLSVIFFQRNVITFHGSGLNVMGKGIIITGESGSGKSTLSKALLEAGAYLLTDDLIVIDVKDNEARIKPGYPRQKLWADSANYFNISIEMLNRTDNEADKYYIPVNNFQHESQTLSAIFLIRPCDEEHVTIKKVKGIQKLILVFENAYIFPIAEWFGVSKSFFELYSKLLQNINIYILNRPKDRYTVNEQATCVFNQMKE